MTARLTEAEAHALGLPAPRNKYGNRRVVVDNIAFHSQAEANHWCELKRREQAGEITAIYRQVRYPLVVCGVELGAYIADFQYHEMTGRRVVVDVKGFATPLYRWKKKHMKAQYGIDIVEVPA